MSRIRHAVAGPEVHIVKTGTRPWDYLVLLRTLCGIWMDSETCEEDGRETCSTCQSRQPNLTTPYLFR